MGVGSDLLCGQVVSRETFERLEIFTSLLKKWNDSINLVSKNSLNDLWTRHIADSVQVFNLSGSFDRWVDIGSGGGLPGAIIAILAMESNPSAEITLIESDKRKSAFLRTVARETGSSFRVLAERIEQVEPQNADVLSARALADLTTLLQFSHRHLKSGGLALFSKGISWKKEVDAARQEWDMDIDAVPSLTMPGAVILKVKGISRV
ncbi:MAG: 16S rRNA (guanine(527)-N(7))-methyltransferase RsmG [Rhodobacteraceae bacterium]|nr:16S rRNA (guanine(527)-N(7))-methyltransferase RsmG [Paracoccaceae bacterium]